MTMFDPTTWAKASMGHQGSMARSSPGFRAIPRSPGTFLEFHSSAVRRLGLVVRRLLVWSWQNNISGFLFSSKEGIPSMSHVLSSCLPFQTHLQYVKVDFCISPSAREHLETLSPPFPSKQLCSSPFIKRMNVRVKCLTLVAAWISDLQER